MLVTKYSEIVPRFRLLRVVSHVFRTPEVQAGSDFKELSEKFRILLNCSVGQNYSGEKVAKQDFLLNVSDGTLWNRGVAAFTDYRTHTQPPLEREEGSKCRLVNEAADKATEMW